MEDSHPTARKLPHAILARGEQTGHYHEATGEDVALYEDGTLDAPHGAVVTHQEHFPVTVPPGTYVRSIVREYDHFLEESRNVAD